MCPTADLNGDCNKYHFSWPRFWFMLLLAESSIRKSSPQERTRTYTFVRMRCSSCKCFSKRPKHSFRQNTMSPQTLNHPWMETLAAVAVHHPWKKIELYRRKSSPKCIERLTARTDIQRSKFPSHQK